MYARKVIQETQTTLEHCTPGCSHLKNDHTSLNDWEVIIPYYQPFTYSHVHTY